MRICFWGTYTVAEGYPVNRVLAKGLRQAGAQVEEVREQIWEEFLHSSFSKNALKTVVRMIWRGAPAYARLVWRYLKLRNCQVVVVGYAGYFDVILARLLNLLRPGGRRRQLVLVAFISLYDTVVVDRGKFASDSWTAAMLKRIDRTAFAAADIVLVDTEEQRKYFAALFAMPVTRFRRSLVGEDDEIFRPVAPPKGSQRQGGPLRILFFGTYVPLHGIEFILAAADILRDESDLEFVLIGSGQQYPQMRQIAAGMDLESVRFVEEWVSTVELVAHINDCDICLGIFGVTEKAGRVIPYKVYDALAIGKPVITRDSPAARELLEHEETALLCAPGDGVALATAVRRLGRDGLLRQRLARRGRERYLERGSPRAIGRDLLATLEERRG